MNTTDSRKKRKTRLSMKIKPKTISLRMTYSKEHPSSFKTTTLLFGATLHPQHEKTNIRMYDGLTT